MGTLYIAEYNRLAVTARGTAQIAQEPPIAEQALTIDVTSVASAAFNTQTKYIRIHATDRCSIAINADPTALTTNQRLAADQTEFKGVVPGHKIAVIVNE